MIRFQIEARPFGRYAVIDSKTGQVRFVGSLDGARQMQAQLNARERA